MAPKILNLDAFAKVERQVVIAGKTYNVAEQSVQNFIDATDLQARLVEMNDIERLKASIDLLGKAIVGIEQETLRTLSFDQVAALTQFISGIDEPVIGEAVAEEGEKKA